MDDKTKRDKIRKYFTSKGEGSGWSTVIIVVAVVLFMYGSGINDSSVIFCSVGLGIAGLLVAFGVIGGQHVPSDPEIDEWFDEDLRVITQDALKKLDLDQAQLPNKNKTPLRAIGPILWPEGEEEIPIGDFIWKKGKDNRLRFSVYKIALIYTAEHLLAVYICTFNTLKNRIVHEETHEFHYQDIVAVTTSETPHKQKMEKGKEETYSEERFSVSVSSGESIWVAIDIPKLDKSARGSKYKDEVQETLKVMRNLLRDKKQQVTAQVPVVVPYTAPSSGMPSVSAPSEVKAPLPEMTDHYCSNCGREIKPIDRFCPSCGKQLK